MAEKPRRAAKRPLVVASLLAAVLGTLGALDVLPPAVVRPAGELLGVLLGNP